MFITWCNVVIYFKNGNKCVICNFLYFFPRRWLCGENSQVGFEIMNVCLHLSLLSYSCHYHTLTYMAILAMKRVQLYHFFSLSFTLSSFACHPLKKVFFSFINKDMTLFFLFSFTSAGLYSDEIFWRSFGIFVYADECFLLSQDTLLFFQMLI